MTHPKTFVAACLLAAACCVPAARAASPYRVPVHFSVTNNTGVGYSMFVVGNHPDIGSWDVLCAVPLAWHDGDVWSADIGIQAGTELEYKFIKRSTAADQIADPKNVEWEGGDNHTVSVPSEPAAPSAGKRVVFRCPWDPPVNIVWAKLSGPFYDAVDGDWTASELRQTAPGRYEGEVGEPGSWMRFTFSGYENGEQKWYHFYGTEDEDFYSPLDAFCVDGGQVFNYEPQGGVSDSRIVTVHVDSTADGIDGRDIRIYLPRGYNENTDRRYPVAYLSDGQNVFSDPGAEKGGWKADTAADREIRGGRMRETILVGVPCREGSVPGYDIPGSARLWEYLPGTDCLMGIQAFPGLGTSYARFLIDNVKPTLDWNYRTLPDRDNTAHIGSSAGGLLSYYLGTAFTAEANVFGLVGALSGVYTEDYIPNLRDWCFSHLDAVAAPKRIWLDTGTGETDIEGQNLYGSNWDALTLLLRAGHVQNKSLHFAVYHNYDTEGHYTGYGQHEEPAWAARSPDVLDFLFDIRDEVNSVNRPEIKIDGLKMEFPLYGGATYTVMRAENLLELDKAQPVWTTPSVVDRPWTNASFTVENPGFYWIEGK